MTRQSTINVFDIRGLTVFVALGVALGAALATGACIVNTAPQPAGPQPIAGDPEGAEEAGYAGEAGEEVYAEPGAEEGYAGPDEAAIEAEVSGSLDVVVGGAVGAGEVVCSGSDDIRIIGKRIETPGNAVVASGSCDVLIQDSEIHAGQWAIMVSGSGDVRIINSVISGRAGAMMVSGSGDIEARGSQFVGRLQRSGSGEYRDLGGNRWQR